MTEPPRPPGAGDPGDPAYGSSPPPSSPPPPGPTPGYGAPPPDYGTPPEPDVEFGFVPQPGYAPNTDDRLWSMIAHFGGAAGSLVSTGAGGWIAPLIVMLAKGNQSPAVRAEAVKALNFQLLWSAVAIVGWVTFCLSWMIVPIAMLASIIVGVIAGVRAANNEPYNYPLSYPLIR